jgi:hypothetical protein
VCRLPYYRPNRQARCWPAGEMDDPLSSLAVALAAAGGNDLLSSLQLSEAQRSLGLSPHLVFLAGVALALPAQVDGGGATFTAQQERTFARLQIAYGQACLRPIIDGAPAHPTRLYKLSPLLVPAQPLGIAELLRVSTPSAGPTASSEGVASRAAPAPAAPDATSPGAAAPGAALAAACAAAAAAAAQLLAEESVEERRLGTAASVPSLRAKPKGRAKPPKPKPPRERQVDQPGRGGQPGRAEQPCTSDRTLAARDRTLADLAAPPLREIDAETFDAKEWTEVAGRALTSALALTLTLTLTTDPNPDPNPDPHPHPHFPWLLPLPTEY